MNYISEVIKHAMLLNYLFSCNFYERLFWVKAISFQTLFQKVRYLEGHAGLLHVYWIRMCRWMCHLRCTIDFLGILPITNMSSFLPRLWFSAPKDSPRARWINHSFWFQTEFSFMDFAMARFSNNASTSIHFWIVDQSRRNDYLGPPHPMEVWCFATHCMTPLLLQKMRFGSSLHLV